MLSLVGSLLGFGTSFLPKVLDFFQDKADKKHELEMLDRVQAGKANVARITGESQEIVAAHKEQAATIRRGSRWLANLSGSIRPVVTYLFVAEFLVINMSIAVLMWQRDGLTIENLQAMLNEDFMALLAAMVSFWFGSREIRKREGRA